MDADETAAPPPETPGPGAEKEPVPAEGRRRRGRRQLIEWILLIIGALVVALLIKTFLFQAFYIPSASMVPTLKENDRVLVNKLSYRLHDVNRGDIIVFDAPEGAEEGVDDLVKRVIGLPGEEISFRDDGVYVDGVRLEEDYLPAGTVTLRTCEVAETVTVPPDHYWMMGDNRTSSRDSRCFGPIPEDDIVGRVFVRIWPLSRVGFM